jgi:hypothetical protein
MTPTSPETDRSVYDQTEWDRYFAPEIMLTMMFPGQIPPKTVQFYRNREGRPLIDSDSHEVDTLDNAGFEHLDFSGWSDEAIADTCYPGFLAPEIVREARSRLLQQFKAKQRPRLYNPRDKYSPPPSMPNHWFLADSDLVMPNGELLPPQEDTPEAKRRRRRAYEDHIYKSNPEVYGFGRGVPEDEQNNPEFWADL